MFPDVYPDMLVYRQEADDGLIRWSLTAADGRLISQFLRRTRNDTIPKDQGKNLPIKRGEYYYIQDDRNAYHYPLTQDVVPPAGQRVFYYYHPADKISGEVLQTFTLHGVRPDAYSAFYQTLQDAGVTPMSRIDQTPLQALIARPDAWQLIPPSFFLPTFVGTSPDRLRK